MAVNSLGWVGFGRSMNGGMKGADMVVIRGANDDFTATSMSSTDYVPPTVDDVQIWKLVEWNQLNGESYFVAQRAVGGCTDNLVNLPFEDLEARFIFAFGRTQDFVYHTLTQRSNLQLNVFHDEPLIGVPDLPYFDTVMPAYEIPLEVDSYICSNFTFPISDVKYHIVATEALINHGLTHHIIAWECPNGVTVPDHAGPEGSWECSTMALDDCIPWPLGWGAGQQIHNLPPHVGVPLGMDGAQNLVLQVHNNNPTFQAGVLDTNGLRYYYTSELRENDVGVLLIGSGASPQAIVLPPQLPSIYVTSECPEKCTQDFQPSMWLLSVGTCIKLGKLWRTIKFVMVEKSSTIRWITGITTGKAIMRTMNFRLFQEIVYSPNAFSIQ
eukprot:TRINITY_DN295_c0_g1_i3.p1 TRINITY_DN295_c0_g1~~TRINITY_DN295_c0_g1_i3.p1  ORF type:complete len:383 (+),score=68.76 TRINITY_DN295_c0_g1_i3:191-1339(+)